MVHQRHPRVRPQGPSTRSKSAFRKRFDIDSTRSSQSALLFCYNCLCTTSFAIYNSDGLFVRICVKANVPFCWNSFSDVCSIFFCCKFPKRIRLGMSNGDHGQLGQVLAVFTSLLKICFSTFSVFFSLYVSLSLSLSLASRTVNQPSHGDTCVFVYVSFQNSVLCNCIILYPDYSVVMFNPVYSCPHVYNTMQ